MIMTIRQISVHGTKPNHYRLTLTCDDGTSREMTVHQDVLVSHALRKGLVLTEHEFSTLERSAHLTRAYQTALRYLGLRMRSVKEMTDYLKKKGFASEELAGTIEKLKNDNLLNDENFARAYVRTKMRTTLNGPQILYQELQIKGIAPETAALALEEYSSEQQWANAYRLAQRKWQESRGHSHQGKLQKTTEALKRKGYDWELIHRVIQKMPNADQESEWEALIKQAEKLRRKWSGYKDSEARQKLRSALYRKGFCIEMINRYIDDIGRNEEK